MLGPETIARVMSVPAVTDRDGRLWQYHTRSDRHSKVACLVVLIDLLDACPLLHRHAAEGRVSFGVNHELRDFRSGRKKDLDFVICRPAGPSKRARSVAQMAAAVGIEPSPAAHDLQEAAVGSVLMALEAKACMTAHIKALPRLFDELNSSQQTVHGAAQEALAAGFVMINAGASFVTPLDGRLHALDQPRVTERTIAKVRELARRTKTDENGYDALGVVVVDIKNDGSPIRVVTDPPAPQPNDIDHYGRLIDRLATLYASRFKEL